jgi:hypothetical protein
MEKKGIEPFTWDMEPKIEDFTPIEKFKECPSLTNEVDHCKSISDFFNFFLNEQMISKIVIATNQRLPLYEEKHQKIYSKNGKEKHSISKNNFENVASIEIQSYIGLVLLFGLLKKSDVEIARIWSKDRIHSLEIANATMSRTRFQIISACL